MTNLISNHSYFVMIKVYSRKGRDLITYRNWENIPPRVMDKWHWYFTYRTALLQVQYPKDIVQMMCGPMESTGITREHIVKNKIRAKKAKITEIKNMIALAEKNWTDLFPIQADEHYQKALAKLARLEMELSAYIAENEVNHE